MGLNFQPFSTPALNGVISCTPLLNNKEFSLEGGGVVSGTMDVDIFIPLME